VAYARGARTGVRNTRISTGGGQPGEARPILGIVVADEAARPLRAATPCDQRPRHPGVGRVARHPDVHHAARAAFDDNEGEARPGPAAHDREGVAGPGRAGVVAPERRPRLPAPAGRRRACRAQVALAGTLARAAAQRAAFPADPLGAPPPVLRRQALDGPDRLRR